MCDYISTNEALRILPLMTRSSLLIHGKENWRKIKKSNRWYWHKDDLKYPDWPLAKWQETFVIPLIPNGFVLPSNYYEAMNALHRMFEFHEKLATLGEPKALFLWGATDDFLTVIAEIDKKIRSFIVPYPPKSAGLAFADVVNSIIERIADGSIKDFYNFS